jgi:hypothetical protein
LPFPQPAGDFPAFRKADEEGQGEVEGRKGVVVFLAPNGEAPVEEIVQTGDDGLDLGGV